jgi:hypothetical protein
VEKQKNQATTTSTDLGLGVLELLSCGAVALARVRQALHVDSFDPVDVLHFRMTFLSACPSSVLLCARFLSATPFWLELLLLMRPRLLVAASLLLAWCVVACALSHCRPRPVLLGVPPPPSGPSGGAKTEALLG